MAGKFDWERNTKIARISANGSEPIGKDYAEFGVDGRGPTPLRSHRKTTKTAEMGPSPTQSTHFVIQPDKGKTRPTSGAVERITGPKFWLRHVEETLRAGKQPKVPSQVAVDLAKRIEEIRNDPQVRAAYWQALRSKGD